MKVIYDRETDTLTIIFADTLVAESDEDKPGVILDYDEKGNLVLLEILDASRRVSMSSKIEYQENNGEIASSGRTPSSHSVPFGE